MRPALSIFSFKRVVSVALLLALVLSGVAFWSNALRMNDGYYKNTPFIRDDRQYDVLFFGTSHVVNSVFPMQLWRDYGITSYNLAIHGGSIASSYWMLETALDYQKPKVAVMDVLLTKSNYMQTDLPMAHAAMDPFPLSMTKLRAIWDIYDSPKDRAELLFPLDVFHNRWKDLDTEMLKRGFGETEVSPEKGGESRIRVYPLEEPLVVDASDAADEWTEGLGYLEKFILLCQQEGIAPVITYLPYRGAGDAEEQRYSNAAIRLAQSLGAETIDLQHSDLIDDDTDWYDDGGHIASRVVTSNHHSIFGDHTDFMTCRTTGTVGTGRRIMRPTMPIRRTISKKPRTCGPFSPCSVWRTSQPLHRSLRTTTWIP